MLYIYFVLDMTKVFSLLSLSSPSFERQEISDKKSNYWLFWSSNDTQKIDSSDGQTLDLPISTNKTECGSDRFSPSTIQSVSYQSDGNRLNATVWLSSNFVNDILSHNEINSSNFNSNNSDLPLWHQLKFTMAVDIFSVFNQGVDYRVDLYENSINSTQSQWNEDVYEIAADGSSKKLSSTLYKEFPFEGKNYLDFSINLNSISNPQKYRLLFYITDFYVNNGKVCRMVDSTNWLLAPPPQFNIAVSPSSIFMRPGEHKDIPVTISGDTETQSNGTLNVDNHNNKDANMKFLSNKTVISSFANGSSILQIETPNSQLNKSKLLIIPIMANISFPTTIMNKGNQTFNNNKSMSLLKNSSIVLTMLPPLTLPEKLGKYAETLKPISDLWQIFIPIITAIITVMFYLYRKRDKKNKDKVNGKIDEF
jgi:hypothetical protein